MKIYQLYLLMSIDKEMKILESLPIKYGNHLTILVVFGLDIHIF